MEQQTLLREVKVGGKSEINKKLVLGLIPRKARQDFAFIPKLSEALELPDLSQI
jgi:hypothetical protein